MKNKSNNNKESEVEAKATTENQTATKAPKVEKLSEFKAEQIRYMNSHKQAKLAKATLAAFAHKAEISHIKDYSRVPKTPDVLTATDQKAE